MRQARKPSSSTLSSRLGRAGVATLYATPVLVLLTDYINGMHRARATARFRKALDRSNKAPVGKKDVVLPQYAHNELSDSMPSVFDDEEKTLEALYPGYSKRSRIRKMLLKWKIRGMLDNPHFEPKRNSVFMRPYKDARILAHELGHAEDNRHKKISLLERLPFHYKSIVPLMLDSENTPLMRQERAAWDYGGVPEGDYLREAALDTYREQQNTFRRPLKVGLGGAVLGGLLVGAGLVAKKFEDKGTRRSTTRRKR